MVEWLDSVQPQSAWQHLAEIERGEPIKCYSVRWLVSDDAIAKAIAPNMGLCGSAIQVSGVITIPARCITRIVTLHEPRMTP